MVLAGFLSFVHQTNGLAVVRATYIILPVFIVFGLPSTLRRTA